MDLSTAGIQFAYAVETTVGTKPSAFTDIPGVKSIPEMNPEPSQLETTSLNATEWKTYIAGLKDTGGALGLKFNDSNEFQTAWGTFKSAYDTAKASGKATWIEFYHPQLTKAFFMTVDVSDLGFGGAEVDSVLENTGYVVPTGNIGWATAVVPS